MEFFIKQIFPWLIEVSSYSLLLPFGVGLYHFKKQKSLQFRLLLLFVSLGVVNEAVGLVTVLLGTENNLWTNHLFTPLGFVVLAAIYYSCFNGLVIKKGILAAAVLVVIASTYDAIMLVGITQMNSVSKMVAHSLIILMAITYFYKIANDRRILYLEQDPIFLLSCSLLLYYAGTSMSWAMFNQALEVSYDAAKICISIVLILNILFYSALAFIVRRMVA